MTDVGAFGEKNVGVLEVHWKSKKWKDGVITNFRKRWKVEQDRMYGYKGLFGSSEALLYIIIL